jgi:metal-responsive CopG/Arc/MetJ family transcriptional regulator
MSQRMIRTTVALPAELLEAVDQAIRSGKARSRNDLLATALRNELEVQERAAIDADFALMADDLAYQAEVEMINREFADADWEALQVGESRR